MIGRLVGILSEKQPPFLLVDVGGVGYEVEAPMTTIYDLPQMGEKVTLMTHLVVREDAHQLYGFIRESDRKLFRALIKVSGVGAKLALAILSSMDASTFAHCIGQGNVALLTSIPGIGKKSAERLIIEMKDKLSVLSAGAPDNKTVSSFLGTETSPTQDAVDALIALGYKPQEANKMIQSAHKQQPEASSEALIKAALKAKHLG